MRKPFDETPLHTLKVTVQGALQAGQALAHIFFKDETGIMPSIERAMLVNFFVLQLNGTDVVELWFQQDGAMYNMGL